MQIASWERNFQVWHFTFSYAQLLLRSGQRDDMDKRIDVLFSRVRHMELPHELTELTIDELPVAEKDLPVGASIEYGVPCKLFLINGGIGKIYAGDCKWHEDYEWLDAPSHFGPLRGVK
ncbi:hypothetical protein JQK87_08410 [Streptomyces sp. G44]|uniref:hypothetical protein n=1 Tax=Streptomyces sp. G44 TaxID=2807632 RepID=UPI001961223B|nr:hypothetical protein [Streptomyces sp. G44]MBM7168436.1 hypothetical protein [Streptomyces sp. G44]